MYSNLPDIDHHMSKIRKTTFRIMFGFLAISLIVCIFISIYLVLLFISLIGLLGLIILRLRHREVMHTYPFMLFASLPWIFINPYLAVFAFFIGSSHILVDRVYSKIKRKIKKWFGITEQKNI